MTYLRVCNKSNTTVTNMEQEMPILLKHPRFLFGFGLLDL